MQINRSGCVPQNVVGDKAKKAGKIEISRAWGNARDLCKFWEQKEQKSLPPNYCIIVICKLQYVNYNSWRCGRDSSKRPEDTILDILNTY